MAFHLVAFQNFPLTHPTIAPVTPVSDPTVTINGDLMYVPAKYNQVIAMGAVSLGDGLSYANIQSPSLREFIFPSVFPVANYGFAGGAYTLFGAPYKFPSFFESPIQLATDEGLQYYCDGGGDGTTAGTNNGLVWLSDGKIVPTTGKIFTLRAEAVLPVGWLGWKNVPLVLKQTLPVGKYQIVGMSIRGTDLVAGRLVFIGQSSGTRPGVLGQGPDANRYDPRFRFGNAGVFGEFNSTTPPSIDFLNANAIATTAIVLMEIYLDLIRVA